MKITATASTMFAVLCLLCAAEEIEFKVEKNISYYPQDSLAQADAYKRERCVLDVKWPVGVTNFPTVVNFHGGGLVHGGKWRCSCGWFYYSDC